MTRPMPAPQLSVPLRSFAAEDPGGWSTLFAHARAMDAAGVDRLVVSDHVVFGERTEAYGDPKLGGRVGGAQPTGPDGHWLEPLTVLSALAGVTDRVRLSTGILLAALRRPVVLAKAAATLDVLSGGRLDLGVGVGWQREEYEAAGLPFEQRGRQLDRTLDVCTTLWREARASFDPGGGTVEGIHQMPKPLQPGGVPIWVSGTVNPAVARRLLRFGAGWIPWGPAMDDPLAGVAAMREAIAAQGGDATDLAWVAYARPVRGDDGAVDLDRTLDPVPSLVDAGATDVRLSLPLPDDEAAATEVLADVVARVRAVTS